MSSVGLLAREEELEHSAGCQLAFQVVMGVSSKHCCWPLQAREEEFEQLEAEAGEEAHEEEDVRPSLPWDGDDRDYSYKELLREHRGCLC